MAELNFGLLTPPGSQSIGNAFAQGMDQAQESRARDLQMQQSVRQGQMAELQFKKAQDTEARLNQWYAKIAKNGGPTTAIEIENQMIDSNIQHVVDIGLQARMTRLKVEDNHKRDLEAMFGTPPPAPATTTPLPLVTGEPPQTAPAPAVGASPATTIAPMPPVDEKPQQPNALMPPVAPSVNNLDPEKSARLKMLSKNPGVVAAGRIELQRILNPTMHTVDGQLVSINPDGTPKVVFGEKKQLPIVELQNVIAAMPPDDPRRPALQAEVNKALTAEKQGAERIKIQWGQLTVAQQNLAVNQASLKLRQDAPKLGLTDPADIERVAQGLASGRIPVDRLTSTSAPIFAKLLKANPDLDFTKLSIGQAGDKASAVTTARIGAEQTRATSLTPEMLKQHGDAYNTNGKLPSLGSGPQAAVDRVAILRYASENNPTDATTKALNKAQLDALVPLAKQEAAVTNYVKTFDKNIELARAALTKVSNTNIPALNAWLLNPVQRHLTGDPDLKALGVYVSSLQAEFAKIQSGAMGNSVTADAAIKRAQDTINTADSPRAFRAALDAMVKESRNRLDSFEDTRKEMAAKVRGQPAPTAPAAVAPPTAAARPAGVGANWTFETDAKGNNAWVSPDRRLFKEAQ